MEEKSEVQTRDTEEATFLWLQPEIEFKNVFLRSRSTGGHTVVFVFEHILTDGQLSMLRNDYYNGKTLVEPKAHIRRLEDLKNILHEALRSTKEK